MNDWAEAEDDFEESEERPSKSQLKRESASLQALGAELVELSADQLSKLALPDELRDAVVMAAGIRQHGGRKRQLKFIGGLLRRLDVEPIRERLARIRNQSAHAVREHHRLERVRDALLEQGDEALGELLADYPDADRQRLRHLVRAARQERLENKPPKSARMLFRYLRDLMSDQD